MYMYELVSYNNKCSLNDSLDFEEPLEIVDLSKGHGNEEKWLKYWPPDNARVSVVIDYKGETISHITNNFQQAE